MDICRALPEKREFQTSLELHAQSGKSVNKKASHDQNITDSTYFWRHKCGWFASEKQTWQSYKRAKNKNSEIWMWSQELLRWGDSTSPHRVFTLLILWHIVISCSPTSLVNFHFWWMAEVVCELQDFFFFRLLISPPEALSGSQWSVLRVAMS